MPNVSDVFQSSALNLSRAVDLVGAFTDTLQDYRSEGYFGELWKEVERCQSTAK